MKRKAIVIGATGLVGQYLVNQLSSIYDSVVVIARKQPKHMYTDMQFYQLGDFNNLESVMSNITIGADTDAFTCLGTTMRQAGSEEAFRRIDYDYNLQFASICRNKGVQRFFLLSALGADVNSRFFYNQVKADLERSITELGFGQLVIFRPSLLLGKHKGRILESMAQGMYRAISPLVPKSVGARPISAKRVAAAMALTAQNIYEREKYQNYKTLVDRPHVTVIENKELLNLTQLSK